MRIWRLWCKAVGEKVSKDNKESDAVAFIRTLIVLQAVITNLLISMNILKIWMLG